MKDQGDNGQPRLRPATKSGNQRFAVAARYYFHLYNDIDLADDEGKDLPDLNAARDWAIREARSLVAETVREQGRLVLSHRIDIEDERGEVLDSVSFGDVVQIEP